MQGRDVLIFLAVKYNGDWNNIYQAIKNKEMVDEQLVSEYAEKASKYTVTTIIDHAYPDALKQIYKPPFVLFSNKELRTSLDRTPYMLSLFDSPAKSTPQEISDLSVMLNKIIDVNRTTFVGLQNSDIAELGFKIHNTRNDNVVCVRVCTTGLEHVHSEPNVISISEYFEGPHHEDHVGWAIRLAAGLSKTMYTPSITGKGDNLIAVGYSLYLGKKVLTTSMKSKTLKGAEEIGTVKNSDDLIDFLYGNHDEPTVDSSALEGSPIA